MLNRLLGFGLLLTIGAASLALRAQSPDEKAPQDEKIQKLEQKIEALEQRIQADESQKKTQDEAAADESKKKTQDEAAVDLSKSAATVSADTSGFKIQSGDGDYLLKIGADLQVDNRSFLGDGSSALPDTIVLRRARPTFSGTVYKYFDFMFRPDFGLGQVVIYDAYLNYTYFSSANLTVGKFKPPVGLERLQTDDDTNFIERGLPTLLVPSRDIGFQLSGNLLERRMYYAAGVFNGVPDNGLSDSAASDHRDFAGRIFLTPFLPATGNPLSGLGFGVGASDGSVSNIALPAYKSDGQNTFVTFESGVASSGHRTRLAPQAYYYLGPFGLLSEYTLTEEGFQKTTVRRDIALRAWQVQATYILTGEHKSFTSPTPKRSFDPRNGGWGAVELAARVGDFAAERGVYSYGLMDPTKSARRAHEWTGGVNWYLNRLLRISLDYGRTSFEGGAVNGNRLTEKVILTRFQINFI
jgi:phosphate-selective porin OprO/OprP